MVAARGMDCGSIGWRTARTGSVGRLRAVLAFAGLLASATTTSASPVHFASGGWGFVAADLTGLPTGVIDGGTPFLSAGERGASPNLDVELVGSTSICVLASGSNACRAANPPLSGPFSVLVSLTIDAISPQLSGPFTLMLTSLAAGLGYGPSDVVIERSPSVPLGLDTSAVPGFVWNGGFTPFVRVRDLYDAPANVYDYIGWSVTDGSVVTFRYEVLTGLKGNSYPQFTANAVPLVVPEPGAALLLALGLAGLALRRS